MKSKILRKVIVLLIIGIITLLSFEVYFVATSKYSISGVSYDKKLGWRTIKNIICVKKNSKKYYRFSTNKNGFRDKGHLFIKNNYAKRIIFLGDSYTIGWHVSDEELFTSIFEKMVNSGINDGSGYDVMNVSASAWSTDQQLLYLEQEGMRYKPDYVFLMIAPNDIRESYVKKLFYLDKTGLLKRNKIIYIPWQKRFLWRLSNHFCIYQFLQQKAFKTNYGSFDDIFCYFPVGWDIRGCPSADHALFLKQMPPEVKEARYLFKAMLLEMNRLCINNNCKLVLVLLPTRMEFDGTLDYILYQPGSIGKYVEGIAIEYDIAFLDLFQILKLEKNPLQIFIQDEYHFNYDGHLFIAEKLKDFFLRIR